MTWTLQHYRSQVQHYARTHQNWWIGCSYSGGMPIRCDVKMIKIRQ